MGRQAKSWGKSRAYPAQKGGINLHDSTRPQQHESPPIRGYAVEARLVLAFAMQQPMADGMSIRLTEFDEVVFGRGPTRFVMPSGRQMVVMVDDGEMSRSHARFYRSIGGWRVEDLHSRNGTSVNGGAVEQSQLSDGDVIELGSTLFVFRQEGPAAARAALEPPSRNPEAGLNRPPFFRTFLPDLDDCLLRLAHVAPSKVSVLVRGETGTGKELIACAVHELSDRGKFVPINCGALPSSLIEGELFGHARGAFTGAVAQRPGLVRAAHRGTLFLDEVGDLPPTAQAALLRVLQEQTVMPIGSNQAVDVDIRVVAATHRDLEQMIERGEFRRDLYARLAGFELTLPPLRDRREDIGILVAAILRKLVHDELGLTIHRTAARTLLGYPYPGNVRELEQALRSAVLLARDGEIRLEHLPEVVQRYEWPVARGTSAEDNATRQKLLKTLRETRGNVAETGRIMSKAPTQIRRWCRQLDIDLHSFRKPSP